MNRKWLAVGIILLFIGVAVAPSINQSVVTASQDDDLVEVTTQACGIQGFEDTTVKLTREQYQNLEQYLVDFRARLNQTSTREEAVPIFKETVVELDKYGLLPKGMSVEQAQKLVLSMYLNTKYTGLIEKMLRNKQEEGISSNYFCLVTGNATQTFIIHRFNICYWLEYFGLIIYLSGFYKSGLFSILCLALGLGLTALGASIQYYIVEGNPLAFMTIIGIGYRWSNDPVVYSLGWLKSYGLLGEKSWNGSFKGNLPGKILYEPDMDYIYYPAMWGFCGLKILLSGEDERFFLGTALVFSIENAP